MGNARSAWETVIGMSAPGNGTFTTIPPYNLAHMGRPPRDNLCNAMLPWLYRVLEISDHRKSGRILRFHEGISITVIPSVLTI